MMSEPSIGASTELTLEWQAWAPSGHSVHVRREPTGVWRVVYGGFSRSTSRNLTSALAEASGSHASDLWIRALADRLAAHDRPPSQ
jgi:hypothetical protein